MVLADPDGMLWAKQPLPAVHVNMHERGVEEAHLLSLIDQCGSHGNAPLGRLLRNRLPGIGFTAFGIPRTEAVR